MRRATLVLLLLATARPALAQQAFTVGPVTAQPGTVVGRARSRSPPAPATAARPVPFTIVHGAAAGPGARAHRRHARHGVRADRRAAAPARDDRSGDARRHGHHGARRQHAVVPRPHDLLLAGRRQEPESRVSGQRRRHAVRADRRDADHARGDRARHPRRRPALRRRQRVAAAVLRTGSRPAIRRWPRPAARWRSRSASITSSSTTRGRPIRRRRSISRTRRSRAASRR